MERNIISNDPLVYTIDNFVDDETISHIIKICTSKMQEAYVSGNKEGFKSEGRTNTNCWIKHNYDKFFLNLGEKIAKTVNIPLENAEAFQVIHYNENQEYRQHYDGWDFDHSEKSKRSMKFGGQRMCTALCYLNDVEEGGETKFTKIDKKVNPVKGKLLVFSNVYQGTNIKHNLSEHSAMPVIRGEKWAFNLWFREESREKLYNYPELLEEKVEKDKENINNINDIYTLYQDNDVKIIHCKNLFSHKEIINILSLCNFEDKERSVCWRDNKKFKNIISKINNILNLDLTYLENMAVTKYKPGIKHNNHLDAHDLTTDLGIKHRELKGQRLMTISGFLTDIIVNFSKLNKSIKCEAGSILIYNNCLNNSVTRNNELYKNYKSCEIDKPMILFNIYVREKSRTLEKKINYQNFNFEYI